MKFRIVERNQYLQIFSHKTKKFYNGNSDGIKFNNLKTAMEKTIQMAHDTNRVILLQRVTWSKKEIYDTEHIKYPRYEETTVSKTIMRVDPRYFTNEIYQT